MSGATLTDAAADTAGNDGDHGPANHGAWGVRAQLPATGLRKLALKSPFGLVCRIRPAGGSNGIDAFVHASTRARYQLSLNPVGALRFEPRKPRRWMMIHRFTGFPASAFTLELRLCPFRGNAVTTLLSYACDEDPSRGLALIEDGSNGLVVIIDGVSVATGVRLDYAQWQRIALSWDAASGQIALYKQDGAESIRREAEGGGPCPLGTPVFSSHVIGAGSLRDGGCLVLGHAQTRTGDPMAFDLGRAYTGGIAELRLWDHVREGVQLDSDHWLHGDEPGLVGCWRFNHRDLVLGECGNVRIDGANPALLAGFEPATALLDLAGYEVVGIVGRHAAITRSLVPVGRWTTLGLTSTVTDAPPVLTIDGHAPMLRTLPASDLLLPEVGTCRIGPLGHASLRRLHLWQGTEERVVADYDGSRDDDRLLDRANGADLIMLP